MIVWTKKANPRFKSIASYIQSEFGESSQKKFVERIDQFLMILNSHPKIGSLEIKEKNIYCFVLSKQTTIFYKIRKNRITILTLFDTRQNPKRRKNLGKP